MTDREQLLALYQACFPEDEPAFWEWIFERLYCPGNTLNLREEGKIVASLQMLPCALRGRADKCCPRLPTLPILPTLPTLPTVCAFSG